VPLFSMIETTGVLDSGKAAYALPVVS